MTQSAISIENLGKRYTIGHQRTRDDGMRHVLEEVIRHPISWIKSRRLQKLKDVEFWALRDVSIEINQGEVVGIIGRNGAGKSTLLKILSRITVPTVGRICIDGRTASLLEVGTGFHQELTGRENIYLNGAILGMSRAEIQRRFDEIVEFSEIEEFLDTPVKRYSSGMYVRLAFAVAAHLEPEILIVDEVLAVGDAAFQKKCLGKMGEVAQGGRTVLFVSHNVDAVRALCQRAILFDEGKVQADGDVESVLEDYLARSSTGTGRQLLGEQGLVIEKLALKNREGQETHQFCPGEDLIVEITYNSPHRIELPYFMIVVEGAHGKCFTANMLLDGMRPEFLEGVGRISCRFESIPLLPQRYSISLSIREKANQSKIWACKDAISFTVQSDLKKYGYEGEYLTYASRSTSVVIPYVWELPDGKLRPVGLTITQKNSHQG
jgi:lipopolysaccharide transport system ATP-binding protein